MPMNKSLEESLRYFEYRQKYLGFAEFVVNNTFISEESNFYKKRYKRFQEELAKANRINIQ